ncbi:hypothetical protein FOA52_014824 [Chlamydomonas sp. UWO 241]|nr:hypothetical protein FOA52_014824 [Chlamydomonas sp. UWO 241]
MSLVPLLSREDNELIRRVRKRDDWASVCTLLVQHIIDESDAWPFHDPVDPVLYDCQDYFTVIPQPMDLGTIRKSLQKGHYQHFVQVYHHVLLVFENAQRYNPKTNPVHRLAVKMRSVAARSMTAVLPKLLSVCAADTSSERDAELARPPPATVSPAGHPLAQVHAYSAEWATEVLSMLRGLVAEEAQAQAQAQAQAPRASVADEKGQAPKGGVSGGGASHRARRESSPGGSARAGASTAARRPAGVGDRSAPAAAGAYSLSSDEGDDGFGPGTSASAGPSARPAGPGGTKRSHAQISNTTALPRLPYGCYLPSMLPNKFLILPCQSTHGCCMIERVEAARGPGAASWQEQWRQYPQQDMVPAPGVSKLRELGLPVPAKQARAIASAASGPPSPRWAGDSARSQPGYGLGSRPPSSSALLDAPHGTRCTSSLMSAPIGGSDDDLMMAEDNEGHSMGAGWTDGGSLGGVGRLGNAPMDAASPLLLDHPQSPDHRQSWGDNPMGHDEGAAGAQQQQQLPGSVLGSTGQHAARLLGAAAAPAADGGARWSCGGGSEPLLGAPHEQGKGSIIRAHTGMVAGGSDSVGAGQLHGAGPSTSAPWPESHAAAGASNAHALPRLAVVRVEKQALGGAHAASPTMTGAAAVASAAPAQGQGQPQAQALNLGGVAAPPQAAPADMAQQVQELREFNRRQAAELLAYQSRAASAEARTIECMKQLEQATQVIARTQAQLQQTQAQLHQAQMQLQMQQQQQGVAQLPALGGNAMHLQQQGATLGDNGPRVQQQGAMLGPSGMHAQQHGATLGANGPRVQQQGAAPGPSNALNLGANAMRLQQHGATLSASAPRVQQQGAALSGNGMHAQQQGAPLGGNSPRMQQQGAALGGNGMHAQQQQGAALGGNAMHAQQQGAALGGNVMQLQQHGATLGASAPRVQQQGAALSGNGMHAQQQGAALGGNSMHAQQQQGVALGGNSMHVQQQQGAALGGNSMHAQQQGAALGGNAMHLHHQRAALGGSGMHAQQQGTPQAHAQQAHVQQQGAPSGPSALQLQQQGAPPAHVQQQQQQGAPPAHMQALPPAPAGCYHVLQQTPSGVMLEPMTKMSHQ